MNYNKIICWKDDLYVKVIDGNIYVVTKYEYSGGVLLCGDDMCYMCELSEYRCKYEKSLDDKIKFAKNMRII